MVNGIKHFIIVPFFKKSVNSCYHVVLLCQLTTALHLVSTKFPWPPQHEAGGPGRGNALTPTRRAACHAAKSLGCVHSVTCEYDSLVMSTDFHFFFSIGKLFCFLYIMRDYCENFQQTIVSRITSSTSSLSLSLFPAQRYCC